MQLKRNTKVVVSLLALLIALGTYWFTVEPTIRPQDVELKGLVRDANLSPDPKLPGCDKGNCYVVEVSLDKKIDKPLFNNKAGYLYTVYAYVDGLPFTVWDFYQGLEKGGPVGGEDYVVGGDSRTAKLANLKLKELLGSDYGRDKAFMFQTETNGFMYAGNKFPAKIRFYILTDNHIDPHKLFLVYSHYEIKWGKNLSWARVVPMDLN